MEPAERRQFDFDLRLGREKPPRRLFCSLARGTPRINIRPAAGSQIELKRPPRAGSRELRATTTAQIKSRATHGAKREEGERRARGLLEAKNNKNSPTNMKRRYSMRFQRFVRFFRLLLLLLQYFTASAAAGGRVRADADSIGRIWKPARARPASSFVWLRGEKKSSSSRRRRRQTTCATSTTNYTLQATNCLL